MLKSNSVRRLVTPATQAEPKSETRLRVARKSPAHESADRIEVLAKALQERFAAVYELSVIDGDCDQDQALAAAIEHEFVGAMMEIRDLRRHLGELRLVVGSHDREGES